MDRLANLQRHLVVAVLLGLNFPANIILRLLTLFIYSWRTTNNKHRATLSYSHDYDSVWLVGHKTSNIAQK